MKTNDKSNDQKAKRLNTYDRVTARILEYLKNGTVPWRKPWDTQVGMPTNFDSDKPYQGVNILLLGFEFRPSPYWLTYRQACSHGGQVRKGERGTRIIKVGSHSKKGEEPNDQDSRRSYLREYVVFNATQIDGIEFPEPTSPSILSQKDRVDVAESIIRDMLAPPRIVKGESLRAAYFPHDDRVTIPSFDRFTSPAPYYGTLFHELTHATGHSSRLARESLLSFKDFADHAYSKEELVAEIGSSFLLAILGIVDDDHEASASYLASWLRVLKEKDHSRWIIEAAGQASKAADYILYHSQWAANRTA